MNVLIVAGHPRNDSLCNAMAKAYEDGAKSVGCRTVLLVLNRLQFDLNVTSEHWHLQYQEPDIIKSRKLIRWADHIVFVYPIWWGTMPALLKGFIDRVFTAGFAFNEIKGGTGYEPLLNGRSAQIITTLDTPRFIYHIYYKAPGLNSMKKSILGFCGIRLARTLQFGIVKYSTVSQRKHWLGKCHRYGRKLDSRVFTPYQQLVFWLFAWLKALRLQFYPMTFIAYSVGSLGASGISGNLDKGSYWVGYGFVFFVEVMTVWTNELYDIDTDKHNKLYSTLTGGSRVVIMGLITVKALKSGIATAGLLAFIFWISLMSLSSHIWMVGILSLALMIIAVNYTAPPLRLSYKTLGEVTVAFTHSFAVIVCGFVFQGGNPGNSFPWLVSLPLFFAVFPSILLAGIPDYLADRPAGKKTFAVRFGVLKAGIMAIAMNIMAAGILVVYAFLNVLDPVYKNILLGVIPHAGIMTWLLLRFLNDPQVKRIDGLLIGALSYLLWFVVIPILNLLN